MATNEWRRYAHAKVGDFGAAIADYTLVRPWQCSACYSVHGPH
jgi:hypothetical protein